MKTTLKTAQITITVKYSFFREEPLENHEIIAPKPAQLNIEHIQSMPFSNSFRFEIRQKTAYDWVTIIQGEMAQIQFTPNGAQPGTYDLELETYDSNSEDRETLFNDTVTIIVKYDFVRDVPLPEIHEFLYTNPQPLSVPMIRSDPQSTIFNFELR